MHCMHRTVRRPARPSLSWRLPLPTQDVFLSSPHCSPTCEAKFILAIAPPHARCLSLVAALFADLRGQVYRGDCPSPRKMPFSRRRTVRRPARPSLSWRLPLPTHARCLSLVAALFADLRGQVYLGDCPPPHPHARC